MSEAVKVALREFGDSDYPRLHQWAQTIDSTSYMSRYTPVPDKRALWNVILVNDIEVGTIWFERTEEVGTVTLGILLGDPAILGRGIGRRAIVLAIEKLQFLSNPQIARLHVRKDNARAIRCYEKCGFTVVSSGTRRRGSQSYEFYRMEKPLS